MCVSILLSFAGSSPPLTDLCWFALPLYSLSSQANVRAVRRVLFRRIPASRFCVEVNQNFVMPQRTTSRREKYTMSSECNKCAKCNFLVHHSMDMHLCFFFACSFCFFAKVKWHRRLSHVCFWSVPCLAQVCNCLGPIDWAHWQVCHQRSFVTSWKEIRDNAGKKWCSTRKWGLLDF